MIVTNLCLQRVQIYIDFAVTANKYIKNVGIFLLEYVWTYALQNIYKKNIYQSTKSIFLTGIAWFWTSEKINKKIKVVIIENSNDKNSIYSDEP